MDTHINRFSLRLRPDLGFSPHPWVRSLDQFVEIADVMPDGTSVDLRDSRGDSLGSGIFDRRDPFAVWRRYSWSEGVALDEAYLIGALEEGIAARADEHCQRLVSSDADYLPGLVVELFGDVLTLSIETAAMSEWEDWLVEYFQESFQLKEIVLLNDSPKREAFGLEAARRTASGQNLKAFWCEVDGIEYRLNLLDPGACGYPLDLREQHALVGSLCADRQVLELSSGCGAFALHAVRAGAGRVVAVEGFSEHLKMLGAASQKNELTLERVEGAPLEFLADCPPGEFDLIVLNPEVASTSAELLACCSQALGILPEGGILAVYLRAPEQSISQFEACLGQAFAEAGREGRLFARVAQPFDFPTRINFPESQALKGMILQVL